MTRHEHGLIPLDELARTFAAHEGPAKPESARGGRRRRSRRLLAAAAVAILVFAGAAYAAGLDPFAGIGAADRPSQPSDALDPAVVAAIEQINSGPAFGPTGKLVPESARLVDRLASGARIYAIATTTDELCVLIEEPPDTSGGSATGCGDPLSQSRPTTAETIRPNEQTPPLSFGVAKDGVAAVSFPAGGVEKTIPVVDNVWAYEGNADIFSLVVHFDDGSTQPLSDH